VVVWTYRKNGRIEAVETDNSWHTKRKTCKGETERRQLEFITICIDFLLSGIYCWMNYYCRDSYIQLRHNLSLYHYFPLSFILINLSFLFNEILWNCINNPRHSVKHVCPFEHKYEVTYVRDAVYFWLTNTPSYHEATEFSLEICDLNYKKFHFIERDSDTSNIWF
jgi:hypothetical protein